MATISADAIGTNDFTGASKVDPEKDILITTATGDGTIMAYWNSYRVAPNFTSLEGANFIGNESAAFAAAIRRPYRGIQIKEESFASISVYGNDSDSTGVALKNSSIAGDPFITYNFLINSVSDNRSEKHQPVLTFGKDYVYFFGEQPRQMTFNATLLNTGNFRWEEEWWYNYENYFRGTKLAASSRKIRIRVDESIIFGYMINCSTNKDSNNPHTVALSFTIHVMEVVSTRPTKIGSSRVADNEGDASMYGNLDLNTHDGAALSTIAIGSDSEAVRAYNLNKYVESQTGGGFLGAVSRFLNNVGDLIDAGLDRAQDFVDFLYGRNLVIPVDAAYAQYVSGNPQFAEGTETYNAMINTIQNNDKSSFIAGRKASSIFSSSSSGAIYVRSREADAFLPQGYYYNNYDEYPFYSTRSEEFLPGSPSTAPGYTNVDLAAEALADAFNVDKEEFLPSGDNLYLDTTSGASRLSSLMRNFGSSLFYVTQLGVAERTQALRQSAYDEGNNLRFPNETFSIGGAAAYYAGQPAPTQRELTTEEKIQNALTGADGDITVVSGG